MNEKTVSKVPALPNIPADPATPAQRRIISAGTIGTLVEYYDFGIYGYLATTLAKVFFSNENPTTGLLSSLIVFAVAFFMRPIGGVLFGHIGDRLGRKHALALTILGMCAATTLIGVLPGYAAIGVAAPVLLLIARLVQGLCAGGEIGGASAYIAESSSNRRRGLATSMTELGSMLGLILASLVVALLTWLVPTDQFVSWGWRIPFLISLPLGAVGLYIRSKLEDSTDFRRLESAEQVISSPIAAVVRRHLPAVLKVIGINVLAAPGYYLAFVYSSIYLQKQGGYSTSAATWMTTISLAVATAVIPVAAAISDRRGRKPVLMTGCVGFLVLGYPAFLLMQQHSMPVALLGQLLLAASEAVIMGALMATLVELFPATVRYTGIALGFNVAQSLFGGTAPYAATWAIGATGSAFAPAWIVMVLSLVGIGTVWGLWETAGQPLELSEAR